MEVLHWVLIVISLPLLVIMVIQTRKRAKALNDRIEEHLEQQEAAKSAPSNPYEDLASLFGPEPPSKPEDHGR